MSTAASVWVYLGRVTPFPTALALLIVFVVALGRMYLGVHYLADVVAGALLGIVIALAWPSVMERLAPRAARMDFRIWAGLAAATAVAVVAGLVVASPDSPYLWRWGGFTAAVVVALPLEWRFVRHRPGEDLGSRLRCALVGGLGLAPGVVVHLSGEQSHAFGAGLLFLATLWVLLLAPALFARWGWGADGELEGRAAVRHAARVAGLIMAVVVAVAAYGSLIEPRLLLDVREETDSLPDLPPDWRGARVAVIADMQVGMWGDNTGMMKHVVERILEDSPDLVLLAGDFIYKPGADAADEDREAVEILSPLVRAGLPVFAVLGNHDWSMDKPDATVDEEAGRGVGRALEDAGIAALANEAREVRRPGTDAGILWVVGIASHWAEKDRPADAVAAVPPDAPRLVFMHHPDSFESLPAGQAPLAVAGHTHGGQFRLPFLPDWSWMTFAVEDEVHVNGWAASAYGQPGNRLYVNRGLGFSLVPVRIRAPARADVLHPGESAAGRGMILRGSPVTPCSPGALRGLIPCSAWPPRCR